jgi:hypothetical protein
VDALGGLLDQAAQSFGMVVLYGTALLEEFGKVLGLVFSQGLTGGCDKVGRTREDAMLCLRRFSKVFIPIYKSQLKPGCFGLRLDGRRNT